MNKIISIVTPSYNQAQFIEEAIESVLMQDGDFYIDYQINDGGSKDNSLEKIQKYEKLLKENCKVEEHDGLTYYVTPGKDFKLMRCKGISYRYVSERDGGQVKAINKGITLAKGDIFSFLNSDDIYEEGAFSSVMDAFVNDKELDILYGNAFYINKDSEIFGLYPVYDVYKTDLHTTCFISQPSAFIRMSTMQKAGLFNEEMNFSFDYEYWLRLWHSKYNFRYIRQVLSSTRIYWDTKTMSAQPKVKRESLAVVSHYLGKVPGNWQISMVTDASVLGWFINLSLRVDKKIGSFMLRLAAPVYYKWKKSEIELRKQQIFSGFKRT